MITITGRMARLGRALVATVVAVAAPVVAPSHYALAASGPVLPETFSDNISIPNLTLPTAARFAPDGRIYIAERTGVIKEFDSLTDQTPTVVADLSTEVFNYWDRGLLDIALAPNFPADPSIYALYTFDAAIGATAPKWGSPSTVWDTCPTPPGPTQDGCVVSGRVSRLTLHDPQSAATTTETVLINDWCQQFPSHSVGHLEFDASGALLVSGGEGAGFNGVDYGQLGGTYAGDVANPCGDPPGGLVAPPAAQGGALRSQSPRRSSGPVVLGGTIIRVDPQTGAGMPDNPLASSADPNAKRIVAYGVRNPFRFTRRPGTSELYIGDVGWDSWEEVDVLANPLSPTLTNFGWPCYEGAGAQPGYANAGLTACTSLAAGSVTPPIFSYPHTATVVAGDNCPFGQGLSSITGLAFYQGGNYPAAYNGSLFFSDYSRGCIWRMAPDATGRPIPSTVAVFEQGAAHPLDLQVGPGGDIFYLDFASPGGLHRITSTPGVPPPTAALAASSQYGPLPLAVNFDAIGSSSQNPLETLTFDWDLDGNGVFGDATGPLATYVYTSATDVTATVRVTDSRGLSSTKSLALQPGNSPPAVSISTDPAVGTLWHVGDLVQFSATATDAEDGDLPASAFSWEVVLLHCTAPDLCHTHPLTHIDGATDGSLVAPDHSYPSALTLTLTVTDSRGLATTQTVRLDPATSVVTVNTQPPGLQLTLGSQAVTSPASVTAISGGTVTVEASASQLSGGKRYDFSSWSDGGAAIHDVTAVPGGVNLTAFCTLVDRPPTAALVAQPSASGPAPFYVTLNAAGSTDPDVGDTLVYDWDLDGDGVFGDATTPTVATVYPWTGTTLVTVRVTDGVGLTSTATLPILVGESAINPLLAPDPAAGGWQLNGNASSTGGLLVLNPAAAPTLGSAFYPTAVSSTQLTVAFDMTIDQGTGADGMTLGFLDPSKQNATDLGKGGSALGFGGLYGTALAFDTFQNAGEPSANFLGVMTRRSDAWFTYAATANAPVPLRPGTHHIVASITNGILTASVDGTLALTAPVTLPPTVLVGFTGASGGKTDRHAVSNVVVSKSPMAAAQQTFHVLPGPTQSAWTANGTTTIDPGGLITLTPALTPSTGTSFNSTAVPSANLSVSFDATTDQGTGADGMTVAFLDSTKQNATAIGKPGSGLGFAGLYGTAVALDTFQNPGEPSANFLATMIRRSDGWFTYAATANSAVPLRPATRRVTVMVKSGHLWALVAGNVVLDTTVTLAPTVLVGFTASCGGRNDRHAARVVSIRY